MAVGCATVFRMCAQPSGCVAGSYDSSASDGEGAWPGAEFEPGLVSVIVPTYNRAGLIGRALDSLEAQTWERLEIVVVDDGSTDDTAERLRLRAAPGKGRTLRVITQANAGVSAARNAGTRASRGEFIVYLDSDDVLYAEAIGRYVEALRASGAAYCFSPIDMTDENGAPLPERRRYYPRADARDPLFECFWLVHGACYRRAALAAAGPWNEALRRNEDHEFFWRLKVAADLGLHLDVVQGEYRQHSREQLHNELGWERFYEVRLESLDLFVGWLEATGRLDRAMRVRAAGHYRLLGMRLAALGRMRAKNHALGRVAELCRGFWHPVRLSTAWRAVNVSWFFEYTARARYEWGRLRRGKTSARAVAGSSGGRPELLFVSPVFPEAEGPGPARRAQAVIDALSREHRVSLLVVEAGWHVAPADGWRADYLGGRWTRVPLRSAGRARWRRAVLRRWAWLHDLVWRDPIIWAELAPPRIAEVRRAVEGRRFDVVHAFRLSMAESALALREGLSAGARFQLDVDDVESVAAGRMAGVLRANGESGAAREHAHLARAYARVEARVLPRFDRVFACSEVDRARLAGGHADVRVLPNVAPGPEVMPGPAERGAAGFRWLFVGALKYYPNVEGVAWFGREVLPRLRAARACELIVGGRRLEDRWRRQLEAMDGLRLIGEFARAEEVFAGADALVVPLRSGGGTRIKILEAFANGRPVVSTAVGAEGLEAVDGRDFLRADTVEEFAAQCLRLMDDAGLRARLAENGRRLWAERYSPEAMARVLAADGSGGRE